MQRLLMSEGFDIGSLVVTSKSPVAAPVTSVSFLRNLQFDIQANTSPDARVEWSNTSFEGEANLRVRGTWENPILLGRISLSNGELSFAGNRYRLSRGDINFLNPFRLDPELNVQATTTVEQYEVTLDISGPASRLALNYRSDPPLPSSDIISLLALGQTTESTAVSRRSPPSKRRNPARHRCFPKRFQINWAAGSKNYSASAGFEWIHFWRAPRTRRTARRA